MAVPTPSSTAPSGEAAEARASATVSADAERLNPHAADDEPLAADAVGEARR